MRAAASGVIGVAGPAGVEVFVFISVLSGKSVPKAARRYPPVGTDFDHDTAPNDSCNFLLQLFTAHSKSAHGSFKGSFAAVRPFKVWGQHPLFAPHTEHSHVVRREALSPCPTHRSLKAPCHGAHCAADRQAEHHRKAAQSWHFIPKCHSLPFLL